MLVGISALNTAALRAQARAHFSRGKAFHGLEGIAWVGLIFYFVVLYVVMISLNVKRLLPSKGAKF